MKLMFATIVQALFSFVPVVNVYEFLDFSENTYLSKFLSSPTQRGKYDTQLRKPLLNGKS